MLSPCLPSLARKGLILRDRIFTVSFSFRINRVNCARVAGVVAAGVQANVIKLDHNQFVSSNRNAAVEIRITMEAFGTEHKKQIIAALREAGYDPKVIQAVL